MKAAVAHVRDLMQADERYDVVALMAEAGISEINARWGCECGDEDEEDGDGAEAARCECECEPSGVQGWTPVRGEDGAGVSCYLGFGVRTGSGGQRQIGIHGSVARRSA